MKGIITVVGVDKVGIIAEVCKILAGSNINILDISQTIIDGYFNMMMIVDMTNANKDFNDVIDDLKKSGDDLGVQITLQHEDIFKSMHRI